MLVCDHSLRCCPKMPDDNDFEPRLGRMRSTGGGRGRRYLGRVIAAANLARGGIGKGRQGKAFSGHRHGNAAGIGRLLASQRPGYRRVIVKVSIVRLTGKGRAAASAHLRYLQRDGTTRDGASGMLYDRDSDATDGTAFRTAFIGDRHQFRLIVSPEDGIDYDDLRPLTRRLMAQVEEDLGTKLNWVAVDHFNTGHPHSHIVVRGVNDRGHDLVIARDYLTQGIRARAAELVELDLGPPSEQDLAARLAREVGQERLTSIDRALLRDADPRGQVDPAARSGHEQTVRTARLARLARMGLAEPLAGGRYQLAPDLRETLTRMGERGDIIRTLQRALTARGLARPGGDQAIFAPPPGISEPLVGRLIERGLSDEHADRHYLIIDGLDGRSHYVDIGRGEQLEIIPEGAIVRIEPVRGGIRQADRTVAEVAAANGGRYDIDAHLRHDPRATEAFAEAHVRRLEAIRRSTGAVTREPSGSWVIGDDHLAAAMAYEARLRRNRPVAVDLLSSLSLSAMVAADGATWLDRVQPDAGQVRDAGFGHDVLAALEDRRRWLIMQGLVEEHGGATRDPIDLVQQLERRDLQRAAGALAAELDLPFAESGPGARVEGILRRRLDLVSGRYALIERSHDFTLVPWLPVLERRLGQEVSGQIRGDGISWSFGRSRGAPAIE